MGIYDREYYRPERSSFGLNGPRTIIGYLLLINFTVWVFDWVLDGRFTVLFRLEGDTLTHPLEWYRFVTYAFMHGRAPAHIVLNMLALWMFGRDIEDYYGPKEFLRFYLATVVFGGIVWAAGNQLTGGSPESSVVGASGAVAAIVVLYAIHFPQRTILLFFVIPAPAWVVGVLMVGIDLFGALSPQERSNTAYTVHLAGAFFAFLYYRLHWNFGRLLPQRFSWRWLKPRPRLRVRSPEDDEDTMSAEVDRILAKISREGESSLTRRERRTLENASRAYQRRRRDADDE